MVDFDILAGPNQKLARIRRWKYIQRQYTIILSQRLVPRDSESPAVPQNFAFCGGQQKSSALKRRPVPLPQKKLALKSPPMTRCDYRCIDWCIIGGIAREHNRPICGVPCKDQYGTLLAVADLEGVRTGSATPWLMRSGHHVICTLVMLANVICWSFYWKTLYSRYSKRFPPWLSDSFRVHQIRFRSVLRPGPDGGAYSAPETP